MQNYKQCIGLKNQFHTLLKHKNQKLKLEKYTQGCYFMKWTSKNTCTTSKCFLKTLITS
jgi:hypothetical protein